MLGVWRRLGVAGSLFVCLLVASCSNGSCGAVDSLKAPAPEPLASTQDARPKVVILGDSITAGLGLVETQSFPGLLQQKVDAEGLDFEVINGGVSGDTTAGGLRRLDWALQGDVRVLIVALGANDGLRGLSVGEMKQNLAQIIEAAEQHKVIVVLAGMEAPPNYGSEYAASFRQVYRDLTQQYRVRSIPFLLDEVAGQASLNQTDGIHPNAQGAAIVADTVWAVLRPVLDQISNS
jgi:acyl-CoA thioesterase-1